jgi:hypothetical protein
MIINEVMKLLRMTTAAARLCVAHNCFQLLKARTVAALLLAASANVCSNGNNTESSMRYSTVYLRVAAMLHWTVTKRHMTIHCTTLRKHISYHSKH